MALNNVDLPTLGSPTKPIDKDTATTLPGQFGPGLAVIDFELSAEISEPMACRPGHRVRKVTRRVYLLHLRHG